MVGLIPLYACLVLEDDVIQRLPGFRKRLQWFLTNREDLSKQVRERGGRGEEGEEGEERRERRWCDFSTLSRSPTWTRFVMGSSATSWPSPPRSGC